MWDLHHEVPFVEAVADIFSNVFRIRSAVNQALGVMDVPSIGSVSGQYGLRNVGHVNGNDACLVGVVPGHGANGVYVVGFLVDDDVVGRADWQSVKPASKVLLVVEGRRLARVDCEKLDSSVTVILAS